MTLCVPQPTSATAAASSERNRAALFMVSHLATPRRGFAAPEVQTRGQTPFAGGAVARAFGVRRRSPGEAGSAGPPRARASAVVVLVVALVVVAARAIVREQHLVRH